MRQGKYVILYVDDDLDMLDTLRIAVEGAGYVVDTARSAEEGLRLFREGAPDLIIVDLMMEEVDSGMELVKALKLAGNQAPVYLLSSVGDQLDTAADSASLGLAGVFQKPLDPRALLAALAAALGRHDGVGAASPP